MRFAILTVMLREWRALSDVRRHVYLGMETQQDMENNFLHGPSLKFGVELDSEYKKSYQAYRLHMNYKQKYDEQQFQDCAEKCYTTLKNNLQSEVYKDVYAYFGSKWKIFGRPRVYPHLEELPPFLVGRKALYEDFNQWREHKIGFMHNASLFISRSFLDNPVYSLEVLLSDPDSMKKILSMVNFMCSFPYVVDTLAFSHPDDDGRRHIQFKHTLRDYQNNVDCSHHFIMRHYAFGAAYMKFLLVNASHFHNKKQQQQKVRTLDD